MTTPNSSPSPIRVADLSESVYFPRVPANPATKAYVEATKQRNAGISGSDGTQYVWSRQQDKNEFALAVEARESVEAVAETAPTPVVVQALIKENPAETPSQDLRVYENRELAEMRAQFAQEIQQNVAALCPVTLNELSVSEVNQSVSDTYFEQVLASPAILEPPATTHVWGLDYHVVDMEQTLCYLEHVIAARRPSYAVTANLNYAMLCAKNPRLAAFTQKAALTLCDGMPILWRSKLNSVKLPERVAGADLIYRLVERCAQQRLRVYFYGASEGIAERTAANLKRLFPKLAVAGVQCPPFRACSSEEIRSQIARIKQSKPHLLLVALGQPKGEYWIEEHLEELGVPLTIQLGASFDFVAGNATRAPKLLQKIGLEWLHRTVRDPMRLAPRYFANAMFLARALRRELIEKLS